MNPSIAILYVATGQDRAYWPGFYASLKSHFLPGCGKHIYIFSDVEPGYFTAHGEDPSCLTCIAVGGHPWPRASLFRYPFLLPCQELWAAHEAVFLFQARYAFYQPIDATILPTEQESNLVVAEHPLSFDLSPSEYPYERDPVSAAAIPAGEGRHYLAGGLVGGASDAFLSLCQSMVKGIEADASRGIDAARYDESHLNACLLHRNVKILPPWYHWPASAITRRNRYHVAAGPRDKRP